MKSDLEKTVPEEITINLFRINIKPLKTVLIGKRNELANSLMRTHADIKSNQLKLCCEEYNNIYQRLVENPKSKEEMSQMKEWIDTLEIIIENQCETVQQLLIVFIKFVFIIYFSFLIKKIFFELKYMKFTGHGNIR